MFSCNSCQYASSTKLGKCPNCGEFGTFYEDKSLDKKSKKKSKHIIESGNILQQKKTFPMQSRAFILNNKEFERVFTGGIKSGGMYLLGGAPGIGKSTLILQILQTIIANNNLSIGYFSGEEQEDQIIARRNRLNSCHPALDAGSLDKNNSMDSRFRGNDSKVCIPFQIYHSTHLEDIISTTRERGYGFIVIDSIQTIYSSQNESSAGSANQVKYCSEKLSEFCKQEGITLFIIGHITKGGEIAGPKYLEHIVDVVMYLEGDRFGELRFLRSQKNRFGNTDDSGIFEMTTTGLKAVYDLKERILESANTTTPGSVLTIGLDNGRPVLTNLEVLLNQTKFKFPTRNCIGVSNKRVDLVIAILERYLKVNLEMFDIFVNIPGEFKFLESGLDLAIAAGILSQYKNKTLPKNHIFIGELGLSGQIRKTKLHNKRCREVPQGFEKIDFEGMRNIVELKEIV